MSMRIADYAAYDSILVYRLASMTESLRRHNHNNVILIWEYATKIIQMLFNLIWSFVNIDDIISYRIQMSTVSFGPLKLPLHVISA